MDVIPPNDPNNPAARQRAYRIRRKISNGKPVEPEDAAWLHDYERAQSKGASASRRVSYTEEEHAAVGTGSAAEVAASAAMVREEGRREDSLADKGMDAMERANNRLEKMVDFCMARMQVLEDSHLDMWAKHRESRMREVDAEVALIEAQAANEGKEDDLAKTAAELLPLVLLVAGSTALSDGAAFFALLGRFAAAVVPFLVLDFGVTLAGDFAALSNAASSFSIFGITIGSSLFVVAVSTVLMSYFPSSMLVR